MTSANAIVNPTYQPRGVGRVSTIELILSVTEANVCPGARTGNASVPGRSVVSDAIVRLRLDLGVRVAQPGHVGRARAGVQFGEHAEVPRVGLEPGHPAVGVVDVAEDDRAGRAGGLAGRDHLAV